MDEFPGTTTVGEIGDDNPLERMAEYTAGGDKLHMAYGFDLLNAPHSASYIREVIDRFQRLAGDAWPCWALSNHDVVRSATRWGAEEDPVAYPKVALAMVLSLRGSVCLYQGEELGCRRPMCPSSVFRILTARCCGRNSRGVTAAARRCPGAMMSKAASHRSSPGYR